MKKVVILLLALCMLFSLLTACGSSSAPAPAGNTEPPKTETTEPAKPETPEPAKPEEKPETRTFTHVNGTEITVPYDVQRIGCLFGPSYEKVVMLGAEDKIVFDGDFHINGWPWSNVIYKHLNDVPGIPNAHSEPNIEDLVGYEPDVVFNFPNPETTAAMEAAGMAVVPSAGTPDYDSIVYEVKAYADAIGGDAPAVAEKYSKYFYDTVDRISAVIGTMDASEFPRVYMANQDILKTSGKSSSMIALIQACGGDPVSKDMEGNSGYVTAEQFVEWDPEYLFVDHAGSSGATAEEVIDEMLSEDVYANVSAVKNDRVYVVPTGVFFWDAGVQKPLLMLYLASTLHPESFEDVDMNAELKSFYSEFFSYDLTDEQAELILRHLNPGDTLPQG